MKGEKTAKKLLEKNKEWVHLIGRKVELAGIEPTYYILLYKGFQCFYYFYGDGMVTVWLR